MSARCSLDWRTCTHRVWCTATSSAQTFSNLGTCLVFCLFVCFCFKEPIWQGWDDQTHRLWRVYNVEIRGRVQAGVVVFCLSFELSLLFLKSNRTLLEHRTGWHQRLSSWRVRQLRRTSGHWDVPSSSCSQVSSLRCCLFIFFKTMDESVPGKPPYHDLRSMSALYRIVEDDRPPFPPGISAELSDFLLKIFQKNKSDRWTAVQLLLHQFVSKDNSKKTQHSDQPIPFFVPLAQQTKGKSFRVRFVSSNKRSPSKYSLESLHTAFGLMDKDNKGMIATDQLKLLLRSLGGVWTEREMDARISKLSAFKFGRPQNFLTTVTADGANASFETFATIVKEMNALDIKEVKNAFAAVDDSKNGVRTIFLFAFFFPF